MAILSGPEIARQVEDGRILIDPFDPALVNPASVDLRLGSKVASYEKQGSIDRILDCKDPASLGIESFEIDPIGGLDLIPGCLYLMHTAERVSTNWFVPVLDGKSSIGRLGVQVHVTAGYGDPGFDGQYTLEVTTVYPVRVYAGMRFCQMRFHELRGYIEQYAGNYMGEFSRGPQPSRVWRQFQKDKT